MIIVRDVPDDRPTPLVIAEEGKNILARLKPQDYLIALDLNGEQPDSTQLAASLMRWFEAGGSEIVFVIGGANGLSDAVLRRAQQRLCLSRLTWTHQMTRLLLLEQCYRAFRILASQTKQPMGKRRCQVILGKSRSCQLSGCLAASRGCVSGLIAIESCHCTDRISQ